MKQEELSVDGKIDDRFKIKVHPHKGKTLKITAHSGELPMKVGQVWSMKLVLKEDHLYIEEAPRASRLETQVF